MMKIRNRILSAGLAAVFALSGIGTVSADPLPQEDIIQLSSDQQYSRIVNYPDTADIDTAEMVRYGSTTYKVVVKKTGEQYGRAYTVEGTETSVTIPPESYTELSDIEAVEVIPVYQFDLGSLDDVEPGMTGVDASTDFAANGYGFADSSLVANREVSDGTGAGKDSVYFKTSGEGSFDVALDNGEYAVMLMNGQMNGRVSPWAEGLCMGNEMFVTNEKRDMQVTVSDGVLNLQIRNAKASDICWALSYVEIARVSSLEKRRINVFFGGDSTVYGYKPGRTDFAGIGQMLPIFMPDNEFVVANYGIQGWTTEIYLDKENDSSKTDKFSAVEKRLQPGDYHLIQLGINDWGRGEYKISKEQYGANLRELVERTRAKGANPVLIAPQGRLQDIYRLYYSDEMETVAAEMDVPFIDNRNLIGDFYTELGGNNADAMLPYIAPEDTGNYGLHLTPQGALNCARSIAEQLKIQLPDVFGNLYTTTYETDKLNPLYNADLKVNFDGGKITAKADMQFLGVENAPDVKVFMALYNSADEMIGTKVRSLQLKNYSAENCTAPETVTLIWENEPDAAYVKMFLWDAAGRETKMHPLTNVLTVNESNFTPDGTETESPVLKAVTVDSKITGGTVKPDKTFAMPGETITLTVTPDAQCQFIEGSLKQNGTVITQTGDVYSFVMPDADVTITAEFVQMYFNITIDSGITGGTVTADKTKALEGETITLTVTPDTGYALTPNSLKYDDTLIDTNTLTFTMPKKDIVIQAKFEVEGDVVINEPVVVANEDFTKLPETWNFKTSSSNASYHVNYKDYEGTLTMNRQTSPDGGGKYSKTGDTVTASWDTGFDGILKVQYDMIEPALMEGRTGKLGLYSGSDLIFEAQNNAANVIYTINGADTTAELTTVSGGAPAWLTYDLLINTYSHTISGTITSKADNSTVTIPETAINSEVTSFSAIVATASKNIGGVAMDNFKVTRYASAAEMAQIKADNVTGINDTDNTTKEVTVTLPRGWSLLSAVSDRTAVATAAVTDKNTGAVTVVGQPGGGMATVNYVAGLNGTNYTISGSFTVMVDSDKAWIDYLYNFSIEEQNGNTQEYNPASETILTMNIVDPKDKDGNIIPIYAEDFRWLVDLDSANKGITVTGNRITVPKGLEVSISAPIVIGVQAIGIRTDGIQITSAKEITLTKALTYLYGPIDYEDGSVNGWTNTANAGTYKNVSDATDGIGKHMQFHGTNGRSYILDLPTPITQNFVFEADMTLARDTNMGEFALLSSAAKYDNKNISNKGGYVLKMDMPSDQNVIVLNNPETEISMSGKLADFAQPAVVSEPFSKESTGWMHVKALGNFTKKTVTVEITSYDRTKTYFSGQVDMSDSPEAKDIKKLLFFSGKNDSTYQKIDNVSIRLAEPEEIEEATFYQVDVTTDLGAMAETKSSYVKKNGFVALTDHSTIGYDFKGWKVNDDEIIYTTEQVNAMPITGNTTIVAQYTVKPGYEEPLSSVGFISFPANDTLVMSADESFNPNLIALAVTGERKSDLSVTENTKILWEFTGFRTMPGGQQTGDPAGDFALDGTFPNTQSYCDTYATVTVDSADDPSIEFKLKNTSMNFYGRVKATVTYKDKTLSVERPLVILGNSSKKSGQILPNGGYPADYSEYEDISGSFSDYISQYTGKTEVYLGDWITLGDSPSKSLSLKAEEGRKFLSLSRGTSGTAFAQNAIDAVTQQTIFSQEVRFGGEGDSFSLTTKSAESEDNVTAFKVSYTGGKIKLNNTDIMSASANTWYRIVVSADPSTDKCYAKVYSLGGDKLAETEIINFAAACDGPAYYHFSSKTGNLDFNHVTANVAVVNDDETFTLSASSPNITIPADNTAAVTTLTASAFTTDSNGSDTYPATGLAVWAVDDPGVQETDVTVIPNKNNSASASVSVYKTAASGNLPISVNIGGVTRQTTLKLTGSSDSIAFTSAPNSLFIPANGSAEYTFAGEVRGGDGNPKTGTVTYAVYDKTNTNLVSDPAEAYGITLDSSTGKLTVGADAIPSQFTVRATSGALSRGVSVNMYNWKFDFGSGEDGALLSGYTSVSPSDLYSDAKGYGIVGTAAAGTTSAFADENGGEYKNPSLLGGDYLSGTGLAFRVKVEKGKVYNVLVGYQGSLTLEAAQTGLYSIPGIEKPVHENLSGEQFSVAVVGDGVLDINVSGQIAYVTVTAQEDKTAGTKPTWISTGDSTVAQNPAWAYVLASDDSKNTFSELYNTVNFANKGRGARHLTSYYTEGRFDGVLQAIRPGDVVSLTGWGTNYSSGTVTNAQFREYLEYYIDAIEDMGAYVILGSYSSEGRWSKNNYDENSLTFKGSRLTRGLYYDVINKAVYDERSATDDKIIGFIDVGAICDEFMTAKVRKVYRDALSAGKNEADAKAEANAFAKQMDTEYWPKDQHYTKAMADLILADLKPEDGAVSDSLTQQGKGIVSQALDLINRKVMPDFVPGSTETYKPKEIWLAIGQSNMAGRAGIQGQDLGIVENAYLWTDGSDWTPAGNLDPNRAVDSGEQAKLAGYNRYSDILNGNQPQGISPAYGFSKVVAPYLAQQGKDLGLVVNARGGTGINSWGTSGYLGNAITRANAALDAEAAARGQAKGTVKLAGIIWHQGENDVNNANYMSSLKSLVNNLKNAGITDDDTMFICGEILQENHDSVYNFDQNSSTPDSSANAFNVAIHTAPTVIGGKTAWVSSDGLTCNSDRVHFNSVSQRILGQRYGEAAVALMEGTWQPPADDNSK